MQGSRKHTWYADEEVVVGIPFEIAGEIEEGLGRFRGRLNNGVQELDSSYSEAVSIRVGSYPEIQ